MIMKKRFEVLKYQSDPTNGSLSVASVEDSTRANRDGNEANTSLTSNAFLDPENRIDEESEDPRLTTQDSAVKQRLLAIDDAPIASAAEVTIRKGNRGSLPFASVGRKFADRQKCRLVLKDGSCNVVSKNVLQRRRRYLVDLFTTFVDMKWRWNLLMFGLAFIISWLVFALIWWVIAVIHNDHLHVDDSDWVPCVVGVNDFTTAFLFSLETQHTIGYGSRSMETVCPPAVILLMLQSCLGVFIQSLMTGLIFAKLSRPKGRAQTMMFSRQAVICQRDGEYCLLFRLGDMRKSHIIGTTIRAMIVMNRRTAEGEEIPMCQYSLPLETEAKFEDGFLFLIWPVTVVHRINDKSPLWELSAESLLAEKFEIIIILEGTIESTGNTAQFRASYLPTEILWGHRLTPLFTDHKISGQYDIDYRQFHNVIAVDSMPVYSAKEHNRRKNTSPTSNDNFETPDYTTTFTAKKSTALKAVKSWRMFTTRSRTRSGSGIPDAKRTLQGLPDNDVQLLDNSSAKKSMLRRDSDSRSSRGSFDSTHDTAPVEGAAKFWRSFKRSRSETNAVSLVEPVAEIPTESMTTATLPEAAKAVTLAEQTAVNNNDLDTFFSAQPITVISPSNAAKERRSPVANGKYGKFSFTQIHA